MAWTSTEPLRISSQSALSASSAWMKSAIAWLLSSPGWMSRNGWLAAPVTLTVTVCPGVAPL